MLILLKIQNFSGGNRYFKIWINIDMSHYNYVNLANLSLKSWLNVRNCIYMHLLLFTVTPCIDMLRGLKVMIWSVLSGLFIWLSTSNQGVSGCYEVVTQKLACCPVVLETTNLQYFLRTLWTETGVISN